jgi:hypothetical protein
MTWLIGQLLLPGDVILHAPRRFQRYALAGAQPAAQLAVVYRLAPEGGFGDAGNAAIALDLLQQLLIGATQWAGENPDMSRYPTFGKPI